ncbi:MAG TPA: DUF2892 domain-containing protein [Kofleriaceae bacterium]|jgi:hypothetical protein
MRNLGSIDRLARVLGAAAMLVAAAVAPMQTAIRVALGGSGVYLVLTALAGTCLGYRMMGRSTCPTKLR